MTRNAEISVPKKEEFQYNAGLYFDQKGKNGLERLSSLESSTGSINGNSFRKSTNRNSMSSTHDSGLCSSSDISTAGHSTSYSDVEYEKSLSRKCQSEHVTSTMKFPFSHCELNRPCSVSSLPISRLRNSSTSPSLRTTVIPAARPSRQKFRPSARSSQSSMVGYKPASTGRMLRQQSSTLPGWDIITTEAPKLRDSKSDQRIEEMVETEREYVKSLNYIIDNYFPEMERSDIPATLRGHRSALFGNLEKIRDFHQNILQPELERSKTRTSKIASIFLKYEPYLEMYALYVKNKPTSDRLLAESGKFFHEKQLELGDKMDLASYLLKPVQRLGKYSLFLEGISKSTNQKTELLEAKKIIQFQLQYGDNLLAMDSIKGCEIDLKEQGKLLRQTEFTVMSGRKKAVRRIFLFENMILFTKPKRTTQGGDVYQYKNSWLTSEVGLTASVDDPLKFEIWLRRRTREVLNIQSNDTNAKTDWVNEINSLLLSQADKYREQRLQEMANMGVGNKPLMDIEGSNTITDRSVSVQHYRVRNSVAMSSCERSKIAPRTSQSIPRNISLFSPGYSKTRPSSIISNSQSSTTCSSTDNTSSNKQIQRPCIATNIFNKLDDVFRDDESDIETLQPAYRQYETTV